VGTQPCHVCHSHGLTPCTSAPVATILSTSASEPDNAGSYHPPCDTSTANDDDDNHYTARAYRTLPATRRPPGSHPTCNTQSS